VLFGQATIDILVVEEETVNAQSLQSHHIIFWLFIKKSSIGEFINQLSI
jgi:hypothetical protein